MTETPAEGAPAPNLFARAAGMIFAPRATFERFITHAPKVLGIVLLTGFVIGLAQGLPQFTESGRQAALDMQVQQIERFTGQPVTDQAYAAMERQARIGPYMAIAFTPVGIIVMTVIFAGLYFVVFNVILGGTASFKQVMSVTGHGGVIAALGVLLAAPVQYLQGTMSTMGPFTLSALVPMLDESSFLARFLGFLNVFSIWGAIVTAIGFSVLYRRKTGNIAIGLLVLTACIAALMAVVTGLFTGR
jgi:hypothetical protein